MKSSRATANFIWNMVGTGINCAMSFVYVIFITRINGIDIAGMFSVCYALSFILYTFCNLGNRVYEVSDRVREDRQYMTLKLFACALTLVLSAVLCIVLRYERTKSAVLLMLMVMRCIEAGSDTAYAVLQRQDRLDLVGISYVLKNGITLAVFLLVDILTGSILLAAASMIVCTFLVFLLFDLLFSNRIAPLFSASTAGMSSLIRELLPFVAFSFVVVVIGNIPRLIADLRYTDEQMGFFTVIMMIPSVMAMLGQFVIQPCLNDLTVSFGAGDLRRFGRITAGMFAVLTGCGVVAAVAARFLGPPVLGWIMGVDLSGYGFSMVIAIAAGVFQIFTTVLSNLLTVMRRTKKQLLFYALTLVLEIAAVYAAVCTGDFTKVFLAYLAVMAAQFVLFGIYFLKAFRN